MSKIYLELRSGLGNQLFQFAFGYALAAEFGRDLVLCPAYFDARWKFWLKKVLGKEARSFRLHLLLPKDLNIAIETNSIPQLLSKDSSLVVLDELKVNISSIKEYCATGKNVYLKGYWQNPDSFSSHRDSITKLVGPSFSLSPKYIATLNRIYDNVVGIHVRRGDFLTNKAFGACSLAYYLNAVKVMQQQIQSPFFLIFTNNSSWVEENFPKNVKYEIYHNPLQTNTDLEELFLMSKLSSLIISNSTFSWWGAYLNKSPTRKIICPENWFLSDKLQRTAKPLILKEWAPLSNELELSK